MKSTLKPPPGADVTYGPSGPNWIEDGIIISVNDGVKDHTLEDAIEQIRITDQLRGDNVLPVLIDFTEVKKMTRDVREYYFREDIAKKSKAIAIISKSAIGRMIANFLLGVNKSHTPTKLFKNYNAAIKWLKQHSD